MFFKAIQNLVGPNIPVATLLVFNPHPRITGLHTLIPLIIKPVMAQKKTIDKVRKWAASRQVNDTLYNMNKSSKTFVHVLSIILPVFVYLEKKDDNLKKYKRFYKILGVNSSSVISKLPHGFKKLRSISIKFYFIDNYYYIQNSFASIRVAQAKASLVEISLLEIPQTEIFLADITLIEPRAKPHSVILASLALVQQTVAHVESIQNKSTLEFRITLVFS